MIRAIVIAALAIAAVVAAPTAASAAKHTGCYASEAKARKAHPTVRLKYTKKAGKRCWYASPVRTPMPMPAPISEFRANAGEAAGPSTLAAIRLPTASASRRGEPAPVSFTERFAEPAYIPHWQILIHVRFLRPDYAINVAIKEQYMHNNGEQILFDMRISRIMTEAAEIVTDADLLSRLRSADLTSATYDLKASARALREAADRLDAIRMKGE